MSLAIPREISMCSTTICAGNLLHVGDLIKDERFRDNATITGPPHLRFYCGTPLLTPDGYALGTLCVIGNSPTTPRAVFPTSGSRRGAAVSSPTPRNGQLLPRLHRELNASPRRHS